MAEPISAAAAAFANWAYATFFAAAGYGTTAHAVISATLFYGAQAVIYTGVSMGLQSIAAAQMPNPEAQKTTRKQPRPVRYIAFGGASRMSGAYMLRETVGNKFGCVLAIAEGRFASIPGVYLNDDRVTLGPGGWVQGMANERYGTGDLVNVSLRLGQPTETRHANLDPTFASYWPANARGDGVVSMAVFAQHRSKESFSRHFPNGEIIPGIVGIPVCYDWRDPAQNRHDQATWKACTNPLVWIVHLEWFRFGRSWDRCIAPVLADLAVEADYCDGLVPEKSGGFAKRYQVAGNYPVNTEPGVIREAILAAMDGWLSTNGKGHLIVKAGRYEEPTFTIGGEQIEGFSWSAFQRDEDAINELIVSYVDPDNDYSEVEAGAWRDERDISETGQLRSEPLSLTTVHWRPQAMRLAKRKMLRLNAERRGQVTTGIYGLDGLGRRFIRVQNPDPGVPSMADVVCEVMNVEIDFENAQVVFDVIKADVNIDDWDPAEEEGELPAPIERPEPVPSDQEAARRPIARSVPYPTSANEDMITVVTFDATLPNGEVVTIPAGTIPGLDPLTNYGVFWKEGAGFSVEVSPATNHMTTGSWIFIGWQATSDAGGDFPSNPTPPGGWGGSGESNVVQ